MTIELFAFVGQDDINPDGTEGLKAALVPAGYIPMVATKREKIDRDDVLRQLMAQVATYGQPIRLVRFVEVETLFEIEAT